VSLVPAGYEVVTTDAKTVKGQSEIKFHFWPGSMTEPRLQGCASNEYNTQGGAVLDGNITATRDVNISGAKLY